MRKALLTTLLLLPFLAQSQSLSEEYDFLFYLIGNKMRNEAIELVKDRHLDSDTLYFMKGYAYYSAQRLDTASYYYSLVPAKSPFHSEACFFNALTQAHLGNTNQSIASLNKIVDTSVSTQNMKLFELAGMSLLQRDLNAFDSYFSTLNSSDYRLESEAAELCKIRESIAKHKTKSSWLAAGLSAIVPGLGKIYAGNLGEGVSVFLLTGSMMAVTAENWVKEGATNWKTILFGTITSVFYIGNIYGSAVTVRVANDIFNNETNVQILYNIHIPLRNSFRH